MSSGTRAMWMRGGTSKGGYFLADDLPQDVAARDGFLLRVMGSPDPRQIDGMGGAEPLTSKVAIVRASARPGVDVDYLFLQVSVDHGLVTDAQNCGNILAGVGAFAIERRLVKAKPLATPVAIFMENTGQTAVALIQTLGGQVQYDGEARIDGVPGTAAPVQIEFKDTVGSSCGALLPTGNSSDLVDGTRVTMIDNGMPCVVIQAADMGLTGSETPDNLEANEGLVARLETLRLICGRLMNLGDVTEKTIPKMSLITAATSSGTISTRTFIPHRCHKAIGVLGAVSVATACLLKGSVADGIAEKGEGRIRNLSIQHPTGEMTVVATLDDDNTIASAAILRTTRKLMDGWVYV